MAAYNDMENSEKVKTCDKSVTRWKPTPDSSLIRSTAVTANLETNECGQRTPSLKSNVPAEISSILGNALEFEVVTSPSAGR